MNFVPGAASGGRLTTPATSAIRASVGVPVNAHNRPQSPSASRPLGAPALFVKSCSSVTPLHAGSIVAARSGNDSPTVVVHDNLPCSTSSATSVAVIDLVQDPICHLSSMTATLVALLVE